MFRVIHSHLYHRLALGQDSILSLATEKGRKFAYFDISVAGLPL